MKQERFLNLTILIDPFHYTGHFMIEIDILTFYFFVDQYVHLDTLSFNSADLKIFMSIVYDLSGISLRAVTSSFTPVGSDVQLVLDASLVSVVLVLVLVAL